MRGAFPPQTSPSDSHGPRLRYHAQLAAAFQARFLQPHVVHGGAIYSLADATAAHALLTLLEDGEGLATVEQNISFLKGVRREDLYAEGRVVHLGRTIAHAEASVMLEDGTLVARSSATLMRLSRRT